MSADSRLSEEDSIVAAHPGDARAVLIYLVAPESDQYIAIMEVLEGSVTDLTPREVVALLQASGSPLVDQVVEARLDKLRKWGAVSARTDTSRILRHADLLARNWRYTATPAGRHVQRFYRKVLAGTSTVREIPLTSLARVVETIEGIAARPQSDATTADSVGRLFVSHDDLDAALVGAEDSLAGLADRFDLNDATTAELKALLVGYATHVAAELERGAARAYRALSALRTRFAELAKTAVTASDARALIERGALAASRGGRVEDWEGLLAWFNPDSGRSERFALRLVRALPGMHVNLRRLHSSSGTATSRSRAVALARACADPTYGTAIWLAALGDHPWRKLYGEADDADLSRVRSWREDPQVEVPELLRFTGRAGARGRAPAARDDTAAREAVAEARERRRTQHSDAVREVLAMAPGDTLSERAARVALVSLSAAVRALASSGRRTGVRDGLACTLFSRESETGSVRAPTWRVLTPGRIPVFHQPGRLGQLPGKGTPASEQDQGRAPVTASGAR
ncbi:MAG: DUF2397 domain-containing protein [Myxococcaceae bacterium]